MATLSPLDLEHANSFSFNRLPCDSNANPVLYCYSITISFESNIEIIYQEPNNNFNCTNLPVGASGLTTNLNFVTKKTIPGPIQRNPFTINIPLGIAALPPNGAEQLFNIDFYELPHNIDAQSVLSFSEIEVLLTNNETIIKKPRPVNYSPFPRRIFPAPPKVILFILMTIIAFLLVLLFTKKP